MDKGLKFFKKDTIPKTKGKVYPPLVKLAELKIRMRPCTLVKMQLLISA